MNEALTSINDFEASESRHGEIQDSAVLPLNHAMDQCRRADHTDEMIGQPGTMAVAWVPDRLSSVQSLQTLTWLELCALLSAHKVGEKEGPAILPAHIEPGPRKAERVQVVTVLMLDIEGCAEEARDEDGLKIGKRLVGRCAPELQDLALEVSLRGWAGVLATSYSHKAPSADGGNLGPRYRLTLPISRPLSCQELRPLALHVALLLGVADVVDTSCMEPARLYYLPRCPVGRLELAEHANLFGIPLDVDELLANAAALAQPAPMRSSKQSKSTHVIEAFNGKCDAGEILEGYGYQPRGPNRWIWPGSTSGMAGVIRLPESGRVFSHHPQDPLHSPERHSLDAFEVFSRLGHSGNYRAAVREAAQFLGLSDRVSQDSQELRDTRPLQQKTSQAPEAIAAGSALDSRALATQPLEGLVERATIAPGAPFEPETLERLADLKRVNRSAFETIRAQLRKVGCRVGALDNAIASERGDGGTRGPKQADILIELAQAAELFHTSDGTGYADLELNGHRETWSIRGKRFRGWLARCFYEATQGAPNAEALQSALNVIEAKAHFDSPERMVHIRVGSIDGRLYLDLGDETWQAVEIDGSGWRLIENPPVRFRRAGGMKPLPAPVKGGSIDTLRSFLNVQSDADFVLVVAWALAVLRDRGPYPVLVLSGEQGSAKSTFSSILRALLDPNSAPLRALPREERDLFIAANNGHVLAFDNISGLTSWISDTLCRLATGAAFAVRQLYSDQDEVLFEASRPVILNGIEEIVTRSDLADRAMFLTLEPIPEEKRRPEAELWAAFEAERPRLLGVLLDAVVEGIARRPKTRLAKLPRLADFALWATACETALWPTGTFWAAYTRNRDQAVESILEADAVAAAMRVLMATRTMWTGIATDLLGALGEVVGERGMKSKAWPTTPAALSNRLKRVAPLLRKIGIEIEYAREGRGRDRTITIGFIPRPDCEGSSASVSSALLVFEGKAGFDKSLAPVTDRTIVGNSVADNRTAWEKLGPKPWDRPIRTAADGADAKRPPRLEPEEPPVAAWTDRL